MILTCSKEPFLAYGPTLPAVSSFNATPLWLNFDYLFIVPSNFILGAASVRTKRNMSLYLTRQFDLCEAGSHRNPREWRWRTTIGSSTISIHHTSEHFK